MINGSMESITKSSRKIFIIQFVGFWFLGLCNNFGYVVMLSAAHDILSGGSNHTTTSNTTNETNSFDCQKATTGTVLLADIIPALIIKVTAPLFMHKISYNIRFILIVIFAIGALVIVGTADYIALSLIGVACASISSGFGEITILQLTSFFEQHTISAWSSGTGAAGVLGSFAYTGLTSLLHISPKKTMLILLFIPGIQVMSYLLVNWSKRNHRQEQYERLEEKSNAVPTDFRGRLQLVKPLLKYMIPLTLVYFAEYLINQGLFELIYIRGISLTHAEQYRWFSVSYQVGVFLSRSSRQIIRIKHLWTLPIIQFINMGIFFACVYRADHIPSIWLVFLLIVFEGLVGGGAYVNTFYTISIEVDEPYREFSMGVASIGDSFGITLAGLLAVPLHNAICN